MPAQTINSSKGPLTWTGKYDSGNNPVYSRTDGALITSQGGNLILSKPPQANAPVNSFDSYIRSGAKGTLLDNYLPGVNDTITATTPPPSLFKPINSEQFNQQATDESSPFYSKELDLALKTIEQARTQHLETKQLAEKFQGQEETQYGRTADRGFADAIQGAQNGYASRGTTGSGIANRGFEKLLTNNNEANTTAQRQFAQATEGRNLGFSQFMDQQKLGEEKTRLQNSQDKQTEILSREYQLGTEATAKQTSAKDFYKNLSAFYLPR